MYQVVIYPNAHKDLQKFDRREQEKIISKIKLLVSNPFSPNNNVTKMIELPMGYRLRVGDIRVIYTVVTEDKTINVWKIKPRGSAYKP